MGMNTAFDMEVRQHCPQAEVVCDLFHVVARFGRDVVDRVRVDQANVLRDQPAARKVVRRSRWLLLRNRDNLKDDQSVRLDELLAANTLPSICSKRNSRKSGSRRLSVKVRDDGDPGIA